MSSDTSKNTTTNLLSITNSKGRQVNLLNDDTEQQIKNDAQSTTAQPPAKRRYHCTEAGCQKSFTTSGHLARHHRIHTGEKNFHCMYPGCPSRFSRQDNMMQHYRTHMSSRSRHHHYLHHYQQQQQEHLLHCQAYFGAENNELYSLERNYSQQGGRKGWSFSSNSSNSTNNSAPYYHQPYPSPTTNWSSSPPIPTPPSPNTPDYYHQGGQAAARKELLPPPPQQQHHLPTKDWINSPNKYSSSSYYYNEFV